MFADFQYDAWMVWAIVLLLVLPIATVALGEFIHDIKAYGLEDYRRPLQLLRTTVLPLLFLTLTLHFVAEMPNDHIVVQLVDTVLWILVINLLLALFNVVFFERADEGSLGQRLPKLFLDLLRFFLVLVGAAIVVSAVWGVDLGGLLTALGVGSIVLGLALQDTLGSLFAGIAMLSARHFKVGDWLRTGTHEGLIESMDWRSITLRTREGDALTIPNTALAKSDLRNFGAAAGWHVEVVELRLAYRHSPEEVMQLIVATAMDTPGVLQTPRPEARLVTFDDFSVKYAARLFMSSYAPAPRIRSDFQILFWYQAQRNGLIFPQSYHALYRMPEGEQPGNLKVAAQPCADIISMGILGKERPALTEFLSKVHRFRFHTNEQLISQGRTASHVFLILSGRAVGYVLDDENKRFELQAYERGQLVVFKSLFRNGASPVTVAATSEMEVAAFLPDDFKAFLAGDPDLSASIEDIVSAQEDAAVRTLSRETHHKLEDAASERVKFLEEMFRI